MVRSKSIREYLDSQGRNENTKCSVKNQDRLSSLSEKLLGKIQKVP